MERRNWKLEVWPSRFCIVNECIQNRNVKFKIGEKDSNPDFTKDYVEASSVLISNF